MSSDQPAVVHIVSTFRPVVGGTQRATERVCKALVDNGIDVVVVTRRFRGFASHEKIGTLQVFRPGIPSSTKIGALCFIVHALWLLATRLREYRIVHVQNIDAPLIVGLLARLILRRHLVATIHGEMMIIPKTDSLLGRLRLKAMSKFTCAFTSISPEMTAQLRQLGVEDRRIAQIPNGVDVKRIRPPSLEERTAARHELGIPRESEVCIFVGRLVGLKQVDLLLSVWANLDAIQERLLLVLGNGPRKTELEGLAEDLGIEELVRFVGFRDDVLTYLHAADVFALPSRQEGLSVALLEAMSAGLPVVASDLPGNRAIVVDGVSGILATVGEPEALSKGLRLLLSDSELARRLAREGRDGVVTEFSLDAVAESHARLYRDLSASIRDSEDHRLGLLLNGE